VFFCTIRFKARDESFVRNKAIYIALSVLPDGAKEILGIWIEETEGVRFWLRVINELKTRAPQNILIAIVDGLKVTAVLTPPFADLVDRRLYRSLKRRSACIYA
jgi:putative transposase